MSTRILQTGFLVALSFCALEPEREILMFILYYTILYYNILYYTISLYHAIQTGPMCLCCLWDPEFHGDACHGAGLAQRQPRSEELHRPMLGACARGPGSAKTGFQIRKVAIPSRLKKKK